LKAFPRPHDVVVVPHAELAVIPYWELLELIGATGSLCLTPSLDVFRMCSARHRSLAKTALLVPDATGSLRYAAAEVQRVRESFPEADIAGSADGILNRAPTYALLHVAGHGVFNDVNPYLGGIIVSDAESSRVRFPQFVASGRRFQSHPGGAWQLLTVADCMAQLALHECRVAVLSTCESGVGRVHAGGELTGLPNAMLLAGAKSVIASLWRVDDGATAVLMHHLYDAWDARPQSDTTVAASLRTARERLAKTTRDEAADILRIPTQLMHAEELPFADPVFTDAFHCFGTL
jgi:CHAT domain-containing protein